MEGARRRSPPRSRPAQGQAVNREKITDLIEKLQVVLRGSPPPWLRKVLSKNGERTFDFEEETENA